MKLTNLTAGVLALALAGLTARPAAAQEPEILEYAVRDGETCGAIARRMYGHSRRYDLIHAHNPELGPMPHRLRAGQVLRLPQVQVSDNADATVTSVRRRVESQRPQEGDWRRAQIGQELFQGWRVSTGERSSAELTFRESSVATIREETLVIVYGGEARRVRREGARAVIREGSMISRLGALSGAAPLEVETPAAVATLGEGEHSVQVEREGRTRVSSHRGGRARVRARQGTTEIEVPEGHGTSISPGEAPTPPRRLPAAPVWVPQQATRYLAIRTFGGTLVGAWQPVNTATAYRVELARRADGRDLMVSTVVPANVTRFALHRLPPGDYFARISTIDEEGFEGRPAEGAPFTLVGVDIVEPGMSPPAAEEVGNPRLAALDGVDDVDFAADVPARVPVLQGSRLVAPEGVVCAAGDSAPSNELRFDALGDVYLTCVDPGGENIVGLDLTVAALRMRVLGAGGEDDAHALRAREVELLVEVDGQATDAQLEGAGGLTVVAAAPREGGGYRATVRAAADAPDAGELRLTRGGEVLATAAVGTLDAPPGGPADAPMHAVHEGLGNAAFASAVGLVDERRRGHAMWLGMHFQSARLGEPDARLRTTAGVRASLLDERLRIGAQVPLDAVGQNTRLADRGVRDVFATVSSLLLSEGAVGLAAEAGLWIPTAGDQAPEGLRHARLQVAADLSLRFAERLTLRTRQAAIFDLVADESMLWASAYGVDVWLVGPLSVGVEGSVTIGREDNADHFAGGVGLALGLDFAPVFVSLVGRYGVGDDLLADATVGAAVRGTFDR